MRGLGRFCSHDGGGVALIVGLMLPVLGLAAGISIDYGAWNNQKAQLRRVADAAALAGAKELVTSSQSSRAIEAANRVIAGYGSGLTGNVTVADTGLSLVAHVSEPAKSYFSDLTGVAPEALHATAEALATRPVSPCVIALAPSGKDALRLEGTSSLKAPICVVWVNSSASDGLRLSPNTSLEAAKTCVVGGASYNSGQITPAPQQCAAYADPLAAWTGPVTTGCDYNSYDVTQTSDATLNPGIYCGGLKLSAANVNLNPGTYVIKDGPLYLRGSGNITGSGVGLYLSNATIDVQGTLKVRLSAPTSGTMAGLVFAGDKNAAILNGSVTGGSTLDVEGSIYLPKHTMTLQGGSEVALPAAFSQFLAYRLSFSGGSSTSVRAVYTDYAKTPIPPIRATSEATVRLVR